MKTSFISYISTFISGKLNSASSILSPGSRLLVLGSWFLVLNTFLSCEKVVDLSLKDNAPVLVIQGSVTNQPGPYIIKLNKTVSYYQDNTFPQVTGAVITIADGTGNVETLLETSPGIYQTSLLQGVAGHTYTLTVDVEGKQYNAVSVMPPLTPIDTLIAIDAKNFSGKDVKAIQAEFQDPSGVASYYRFTLIRNEELYDFDFLIDDQFFDGTKITYQMKKEDDSQSFKAGDHVKVTLHCVDANVYKYFKTIPGSGLETVFANPVSNISNGALGYFSAECVSEKTITVR